MGGTCDVREEPGKQKPRRCRAQELARSSAQENERQKKEMVALSRNRLDGQAARERCRGGDVRRRDQRQIQRQSAA